MMCDDTSNKWQDNPLPKYTREMCYQLAKKAGAIYFSWEVEQHKCFYSATCDHPYQDSTLTSWEIYEIGVFVTPGDCGGYTAERPCDNDDLCMWYKEECHRGDTVYVECPHITNCGICLESGCEWDTRSRGSCGPSASPVVPPTVIRDDGDACKCYSNGQCGNCKEDTSGCDWDSSENQCIPHHYTDHNVVSDSEVCPSTTTECCDEYDTVAKTECYNMGYLSIGQNGDRWDVADERTCAVTCDQHPECTAFNYVYSGQSSGGYGLDGPGACYYLRGERNVEKES